MHIQFVESGFDLSIQHSIEQAGCGLVCIGDILCKCSEHTTNKKCVTYLQMHMDQVIF